MRLTGLWAARYPVFLLSFAVLRSQNIHSFPEGKTNSVRFTIPDLEGTSSPKVDIWADLLHPTCATVVAIYEHDYYAGSPAITLNHYGTGYALYMGVFGGSGSSPTGGPMVASKSRDTYVIPRSNRCRSLSENQMGEA